MRYLAFLVLFAVACGSSPAPADLTSPVFDFAAPDDDMAAPIPPDMVTLPCTMPQPGIYSEVVIYNYVPAAGGTSMLASAQTNVIIKNDGTISRPSSGFTTPTLYHCNFAAIDPVTCLASCCPGQPTSPTMYFDKGGWTFWLGGACSFQTTTAAQYIANITEVEGYFVR